MTKKNSDTYFLDTNIIIDFLIQRNSSSHQKAIQIFKNIKSGNIKAIVIHGVIMEVVYIMGKKYKYDIPSVIRSCSEIIKMKHVLYPQKDTLLQALSVSINHNVSIVDGILASYSKKTHFPILTFDKKLKKLSK